MQDGCLKKNKVFSFAPLLSLGVLWAARRQRIIKWMEGK